MHVYEYYTLFELTLTVSGLGAGIVQSSFLCPEGGDHYAGSGS